MARPVPFGPATDWPRGLAPAISDEQLEGLREAARTRVSDELPAAMYWHPIHAWLKAAPVRALLEELWECSVAADHYNARLVCREASRAGDPGRGYVSARLDAATVTASRALAHWAVLERIPVCWLPEEDVRAALNRRLSAGGLDAEVTELRLTPPVLGGSDWVRRHSSHGVMHLARRAEQAAVAAVLHWPDRTVPAVVVAEQGRLVAFGKSLHATGAHIEPGELVGAELLEGQQPPAVWWIRWLQALGLGLLLWTAWRRWRRLWEGRHVAHRS